MRGLSILALAIVLSGTTGCPPNHIVVDFIENGPINSGKSAANQASRRPLDVEIVCVTKEQRTPWGTPENPNIKPTQFFDGSRSERQAHASALRERLDVDFKSKKVSVPLPEKFRSKRESSIWIYARYQGPSNETIDTPVLAVDDLFWTKSIQVEVGADQLVLKGRSK